jgi:hypothetical protein
MSGKMKGFILIYIYIYSLNDEPLGHAVAHLVEALCYKPEGRGSESRCGGFFQFT